MKKMPWEFDLVREIKQLQYDISHIYHTVPKGEWCIDIRFKPGRPKKNNREASLDLKVCPFSEYKHHKSYSKSFMLCTKYNERTEGACHPTLSLLSSKKCESCLKEA
jgi:hypothetical protein